MNIDPFTAVRIENRRVIRERLCEIAETQRVRILFAAESGSRAWGFPSKDSDFDVRFIYARKMSDYFSLHVEFDRDVYDPKPTDEYDIVGWDLRKALQLFLRSNPALYEWMQSPIEYDDVLMPALGMSLPAGLGLPITFGDSLRALFATYHSNKNAAHHYRSMAKRNVKAYLNGAQVTLKKYLYVLRPLLAALWVEQRGTVPPMQLYDLCDLVKGRIDLMLAIDDLVARKIAGDELGKGEPIPVLHEFVLREMARLDETEIRGEPLDWMADRTKVEDLNRFFRIAVSEAW